jgi:hypothetical protein
MEWVYRLALTLGYHWERPKGQHWELKSEFQWDRTRAKLWVLTSECRWESQMVLPWGQR